MILEKNSHLSGVGGWLTLLIIVLMLGYPLGGLFLMVNASFELGELPRLVEQVAWLLFLIPSASGVFAGYRLWNIHTSESVHFARLAVWLTWPLGGTVLAVYFLCVAFHDRNFSNSVAMRDLVDALLIRIVWPFVGSCAVAFIWTLYLKHSVRVKNTYLPPLLS